MSGVSPPGEDVAVLIVEDNPTNGLILRHLVKKIYAGDIVVVEDPARAIELCHSRDFSLFLVDHMLPGMSGVEFVRLLRLIPRFMNVPAVMVTADTSPRLRAEAMGAGVTEFLTKPVEAIGFRKLMTSLVPKDLKPEVSAA